MTAPRPQRLTRHEIFITVAVAAVIVGLFDWTGIVYLEKNGQARWQKSTALREVTRKDLEAICTGLKVTCVPYKAD